MAESEARRLLHQPMTAVMAAGLVLWAVTVGLTPLNDNSFMTHLATGQLILDDGVPSADPYSFSAPGVAWVVQSWLVSAVYALVDDLGGGHALQVMQAMLTGLLGAMVVRLTRPAEGLIARLAVGSLCVAIGTVTWVERPLLFGLMAMAVLLVLLYEGGPPWLMIPVMWIWANSHGSYPLAIVVLVAVLAGRRLDGLPIDRERRLLLFTVAGIAVAAIGPLAANVWTFPIELLQRRDVLDNIVEWQAPNFVETGQRLFLVQMALAIVLLVRRPAWRRAIPTVAFLLMALVAARNITVANLVLVPILAEGLQGLGSITGRARSVVATAAIVVFAALGALIAAERLDGPAYGLGAYPVAGLAWMETEGLLGPDSRVVAPDFVGNLRSLLEGPGAQVFIDDRYDMWPTEVTDDYESLLRVRPRWQDVLNEREATAVLWQGDQPLTQLMRADAAWRVVYSDPGWVVAVPRR